MAGDQTWLWIAGAVALGIVVLLVWVVIKKGQPFTPGDVSALTRLNERYHAPLGRLIRIGTIKDEDAAMAEVTAKAFNAVVNALRPGVKARDVYAVWQGIADEVESQDDHEDGEPGQQDDMRAQDHELPPRRQHAAPVGRGRLGAEAEEGEPRRREDLRADAPIALSQSVSAIATEHQLVLMPLQEVSGMILIPQKSI